jgi:hypothetical protein
MPKDRTTELVELDRDHILHPLGPVGQNKGIIFEEAEGVWLQDSPT